MMSSGGSELRSTTRSLTALRNRLEINYFSHHVDAAIARTNLSILKPSEAYNTCKRYIEEILIPLDSSRSQASHAPSPVVSSKKASCSSGLPLVDELKIMGFSDEEIQSAVRQGFSTVEDCVDFMLSQDCHENAPPSPALSPAAAASGIIVAHSGTLLEFNGWLYKTAHDRRINQSNCEMDGHEPVAVAEGWDLCFFDQDVSLICKTCPWGSHSLVLLDGSECLTSACVSGKPGDQVGRNCIQRSYIKGGSIVSSRVKTSDVLLRRRGCIDNSASVGSLAEQPPRHTPSSSDAGNPLQVPNQDDIIQQLLTERWAAVDTKTTISLLKQRGTMVTLSECRRYLEKYMSGLRLPMTGIPSSNTSSLHGSVPSRNQSRVSQSSGQVLDCVSTMLSMGYEKSHIDAAIAEGFRDMDSCMDYIAKHFRDSSPPRAIEANSSSSVADVSAPRTMEPNAFPSGSLQQEAVLSVLLCVGATTDRGHEAFFKHARPSREQFASDVELSRGSDPATQLYRCHARWGLQAALYLCHPSFASEDDVMVVAAQNSIIQEVLIPLEKKRWFLVPAIVDLWSGKRDVGMSPLTRQLIESIALLDHLPAYASVCSLPHAFPFVYAETLAIYLACKDSSEATSPEVRGILDRICAQSGDTFAWILRSISAPQSATTDELLSKQLSEVLSRANQLKTLPAYSPQMNHVDAAMLRRRNRCLCLCSAHLFIQSKKLFCEGKIPCKSANPLQPDIDKVVCVALAARPSIGQFLFSLFQNSPLRVPSLSSSLQDPEIKVFHSDFMILAGAEQVHDQLASYFDIHLKWLLDAASGAMSLTQNMMLDASSSDGFAQTLIDRAASLKFPLLAATHMANSIGSASTLVQEKEEIKRQLSLSQFVGLGPVLDRFWGSCSRMDFEQLVPLPPHIYLDLIQTSVKSARWMLAVENLLFKNISKINEWCSMDFKALSAKTSIPPLVFWSISHQVPVMERVVKLIKTPESCSRNDHKKIVEGTTDEELFYFCHVVVPRLREAGFSQISIFLENVQTAALQALQNRQPLGCLDQIPFGSPTLPNMEWILKFKELWRRIQQ